MISFSRTILVGAEFPDTDLVRFHGVLEDHIYAMEIRMDVRISDGVIRQIEGRMKRFTTPVCPKAVGVLQAAVGISLRDPGWITEVNREIGRKGCQHFAEILVECGRCLDAARLAHEGFGRAQDSAGASPKELARDFVQKNSELLGHCLARPKGLEK